MTTLTLTFEEKSNLVCLFRSVLFTAFRHEGFGEDFLGLHVPLSYPDSHNAVRVLKEIVKQMTLKMISERQEWDDLSDEDKSLDPGWNGMLARHEETMDALLSVDADSIIKAHRAGRAAFIAAMDEEPALAFYTTDEFNYRNAVKAAEDAVTETLLN